MNMTLTRPPLALGAGAGLARNELFQIAYSTNDMEKARALLGEKYGLKEFRRLEGQMPEGGSVQMDIAWSAGILYELICAKGAGGEVFQTGLPHDSFAMRLHHLGYFVPDAASWDAIRAEIARDCRRIVRDSNNPGFLKAIIVEAPELGHYLEYILCEPGGLAFFETAPVN